MPTKNFITLQQAIQMTSGYRSKKEKILAGEYKNKNILPVCETFGRTAFDTVLAQQGCVGLRVYFGMDESNKVKAIIVGVNSKNEDILPSGTQVKLSAEGDTIIEDGVRCPEYCPPTSPLNS